MLSEPSTLALLWILVGLTYWAARLYIYYVKADRRHVPPIVKSFMQDNPSTEFMTVVVLDFFTCALVWPLEFWLHMQNIRRDPARPKKPPRSGKRRATR